MAKVESLVKAKNMLPVDAAQNQLCCDAVSIFKI